MPFQAVLHRYIVQIIKAKLRKQNIRSGSELGPFIKLIEVLTKPESTENYVKKGGRQHINYFLQFTQTKLRSVKSEETTEITQPYKKHTIVMKA